MVKLYFRWGLGRVAATIVVVAGVLGCNSSAFGQEKAAKVGPGTAKMAALLEEINRKNDATPMQNPFANEGRVAELRMQMTAIANPADRVSTAVEIAIELLNAGDVEEALVQATNAVLMGRKLPGGAQRFYDGMDLTIALCHLRKGEQDNCIAFHGPESCLLPFRASAVHKDQSGSRAAIAKLNELLARPNEFALTARWLLNIAYMTVGEYPQNVPAQWLIPPKVFESDAPFPAFRNIAADVDLDQQGLAGGVVSDDFDNDGDIDLMVSEWGLRDQLRVYFNDGDGTFTERTKEAGLTGLVGGLNMVQADYNNDGFVDVLVLRGAWLGSAGRYPNSLLRNNGDGTFEDVTEQAGMLSFHPTQTATWFDYNGDGWIDVFIGNESSGDERHPCELYRNNGNGTFTECAAECGIAVSRFVKAVVAADYNNDARPDLYLSIRDGANLLLRNQGPVFTNKVQGSAERRPYDGPWRFGDVTQPAGVAEPKFSFSSWFFDYDNDGWQDLFVSGYRIERVGDIAADYLGLPHNAERARLYRNNGNGTFSDVTKQAGLYKVLQTMGCNFGDLDNDGYLDFYVGTGDPNIATIIPNRMFRNDNGQRFQDVTSAGGFGHLQKGHAIAFSDLDNDGDQDIYESIGGAYSGDGFRNVLFENPGTTNKWIGIKLEGVTSNRSAIGARLRLTAISAAGERRIFKTVNSGGSFGANALRQHIGVGSATNVYVEVFWPTTRARQEFSNLAPGKWYAIREDSDKAVVMNVKPFKFVKPTEKTEEAATE